MVHSVYVEYYDFFWLYVAAFFAVACALSIGKWAGWALEYIHSRWTWQKAGRKTRQYWYYMIGFAFAAGLSVCLYIFQH